MTRAIVKEAAFEPVRSLPILPRPGAHTQIVVGVRVVRLERERTDHLG